MGDGGANIAATARIPRASAISDIQSSPDRY